MITHHRTVRPFVKPNGQVAIRVRWNNNTSEVTLITGMYAERTKWDDERRRARKNTTHRFGDREYRSYDINDAIDEFCDAIESTFTRYLMNNSVPTTIELKESVNRTLGREKKDATDPIANKKTLKQYFQEFLDQGRIEKNWDDICCEKYIQALQHLEKSNPNVAPNNITIDTMLALKIWYIDNGYRNRTINKQIVMMKCFLKWLSQQKSITIPQNVLDFNTNLKVIPKTVTFLHYDELMHFANFEFSGNEKKLGYVRDLWCFMAFTSVRYADLCNLKTAHIVDGNRIEMVAQKTCGKLSIPLIDAALDILARYKGYEIEDGHIFAVPANQQLNNAVKEAAKAAGLDRNIIDPYFIGTKRHEEQYKFYEIISCHDARRTFVSCSLAMGIPAEVVMKATGHRCYNTMKPYIDTATETQSLEMEKWNRNRYRSEIITAIDKANEKQLQAILSKIKEVI